MAGLSLKNVTKYYQNGHVAVRDFTLDIADSEFVVLVGPEGCGRSTVLRMIAGLEDISSGELLIDGKRVNEEGTREREVAMLFENSDFVLMLNQAQGDRTILAKQLNISPQQMKYVTHTEAGEGLIFYGNVVLPFVDRFPKDTELYRVMTTKPEEVSESGR